MQPKAVPLIPPQKTNATRKHFNHKAKVPEARYAMGAYPWQAQGGGAGARGHTWALHVPRSGRILTVWEVEH